MSPAFSPVSVGPLVPPSRTIFSRTCQSNRKAFTESQPLNRRKLSVTILQVTFPRISVVGSGLPRAQLGLLE